MINDIIFLEKKLKSKKSLDYTQSYKKIISGEEDVMKLKKRKIENKKIIQEVF